MYKPKLEKDIRCPLEYGLSVFGGRWKTRIIRVLDKKGEVRYSTLREELGDITDTVLSVALKEMTTDGLISRRQYEGFPPRVEYSLTSKGYSVVPVLQYIRDWALVYYADGIQDIFANIKVS